MRFGSLVGLACALVGAGCAHTVGSLEVAARANVEFSCDASDLYVQTLARNHYAATGCGRRAVFICQSGACARDSEPAPVNADARVIADGHDARRRLNDVRPALLACVAEEHQTVPVEVTFATDGTYDLRHEIVGQRFGKCIDDALETMLPAAHAYEYPIYFQHTFGPEPWAPPTPAPAAPAAAPPPPPPPVEPVAPVEPPPGDPATTEAPPPPVP